MVKSREVKEWTVIFLVDTNPAHKVVVLKRAATKSYAPNMFTGIGGKIGDLPGFYNETPLEGAYRELKEETEGQLGSENTALTEFAHCFYDSGLKLHYFWGYYTHNQSPHMCQTDGFLSWVDSDNLLKNDFIPTTGAVCLEWQKRGFNLDTRFTLLVHETGIKDGVRKVKVIKVTDSVECRHKSHRVKIKVNPISLGK